MEKTGSILKSIFDSTDDVWIFIAPDYSILFFNQKAYDNGKLFHGKVLEAGDSILEYALDTKNNVTDPFISNFQKALEGQHIKDVKRIEYENSSHWFESKFVPVYHEGKLTGVSITVSDVSKEKLLELEQVKNKAEITMLLRRREEFMSIASHELKTPLTGAKGFIQTLKRKAATDKLGWYETLLNRADLQINKLTNLINELLDISGMESGKLVLKKSTFKINQLVYDCLQVLQPIAHTHRIQVESDEDIEVCADKNRLEQVICNLLSNALKYSPEGSQITVKTALTSEYATLSIKDEGFGIPPEKLSRLFERFFRVDESNVNKSGLGLGLYISKDIIERHNGKIEVKSEEGRGSEFTIYLPNKQ